MNQVLGLKLLSVGLAFVLVWSDRLAAAEILFPAEQFGAVDLVPRQSTSRLAIETLGAFRDRFELISEFREDDPVRKAGRPIGRLDILVELPGGERGVSVCTAAVIDTDKIITNYHCIPGLGGQKIRGAKLRLGYLHQGMTDSRVYDVNTTPIQEDRRLDYSILTVAGNPSATFGRVSLIHRQARDGESLFLIHHPAGQPQRLTRAFCKATSAAIHGEEIRHRCDTLPGSSGSLIFSQIDNALVGLHHSGGLQAGDSSSFNRGTDILPINRTSSVFSKLCCPANVGAVTSPLTPTPPPPLPRSTGISSHIADDLPVAPSKANPQRPRSTGSSHFADDSPVAPSKANPQRPRSTGSSHFADDPPVAPSKAIPRRPKSTGTSGVIE